MYIKPIHLRILCAGMIILAVMLNHINVENEAEKEFLSRIATFLYIAAFGLLLYFGTKYGFIPDE